jgi:hypothetical protein
MCKTLLLVAGCLLALAAPARAQSVATVRTLSFGSFAAGSGGTVTVSAGGARSSSSGVTLVSSGAGTSARFQLTGTANQSFSFSLPVDNVVTLSRESGGGPSMAVNGFTSSLQQGTGVLGAGGTGYLDVGATLSVSNGQQPGNYQGSFEVIVNFN